MCLAIYSSKVEYNVFPLSLFWGASRASQVALAIENPPGNIGDLRDVGSIPGSGRSPGEGNGHPLLYFCLENPITEELDRVWSIGSQTARHG